MCISLNWTFFFGGVRNMKTNLTCFLSYAVLVTSTLFSSVGQATIIFNQGVCNPSDGCDQSVNFSPANSGTTVVGDTNPPSPLYNVYVDSLQGLTLHGSGSTVDTGNQGPGFTSILIRPETGYAWGTIEFQLDSFKGDQPQGTGGLTFTAWDQSNTTFSFNADLPWEGNKGENQHYHFHGINGEVITQLRIDYADPLCVTGAPCNTINDIHNIDVNTQVIPEPGSIALLALGLLALGSARQRKPVCAYR